MRGLQRKLPGKALAPVLPLLLAELSSSDFVNVASALKERYEMHRGVETADNIVAENRELCRAV